MAFAFPTATFSARVGRLAAHANPVANILIGIDHPITVTSDNEQVRADLLFIRPGVAHSVACGPSGFEVIYLDGLHYPDQGPFARALRGNDMQAALDTVQGHSGAASELRARLRTAQDGFPDRLGEAILRLIAEPMQRMSQFELAEHLQLERTSALRAFKRATGQTFRQFKQWTALQHATRQIAAGELVRTAAMDAGFADTAHLSRTFKASFGLSPAQAIAAQG